MTAGRQFRHRPGEPALGSDQEYREAVSKAQFQPGGSPAQVHLDPESQAGTG